jgi:VWFA-related protein
MQAPTRPLIRTASWALALALVLALAGLAPGQSGRRPKPTPPPSGADAQTPDGEEAPDVQLGTQEVLLSVTVRDAEGRPVTNLGKEDFIIAEDRVRQTLESFGKADVPVHVVLLLDASGSVFSERTSIRRAAARFVEKLGANDRIAVVQFADTVELIQDWTGDDEEVRHALNWRYRGGEATALWDAVYLAAEHLAGIDGRRAIIILSDGVDTKSEVTPIQAQAAVDRVGAMVYVVSKAEALVEKLKPYAGVGGRIAGTSRQAQDIIGQLKAAQERMREMADRAGGRLFAPLREVELEAVYGQVADELRQQYVLSYVPQNERRDGRWRNIEIYLTRPGLVARTRRGYVAE